MVSELHDRITLGLNHQAIFKGKITTYLLDYFSFWGVRYIVTGCEHETLQCFEMDGRFKRFYENHGFRIYENQQALSLVYALNRKPPRIVPENTNPGQIPLSQEYLRSIFELEKREVQYRLGVNEMEIFTESNAAFLVVNIAPIEGYRIWFDGKPAGEIDEGQIPAQISVPEGVGKVTLKFREPTFSLSLILFAAGICILLVFYFSDHECTRSRKNIELSW